MSDIQPTEEPDQPEPGPGYWPAEWQRHIERAERNLAENPPPEFPVAPPFELPPETDEPEAEPKGFDPSNHTVNEVEEYVCEHPDERAAVLDAERAGKDRVTLVEWLESDAG